MSKLFKIKRIEEGRWVPDHPEILVSFPIALHDDGTPEHIQYQSLFEQVSLRFPFEYHLEPTLEEAKQSKYAEIDKRTKELIEEGMPFGGKIYSLSEIAQINYAGMLIAEARGFMGYPMTFNTLDDRASITITNASELDQFCGAAMAVVALHKGTGTELKKRVLEAPGWDELNQIVDDRSSITLPPPPPEEPPEEPPPEEPLPEG